MSTLDIAPYDTHSPPEPASIAPFYDYVIVGGGPAGATLGALLAEGGRSVLILEAARFPRLTVGEIVAPTALWRVWHRLGIDQETLDRLFIRKWRGAWQSPSGVEFRFEQDVHPDDGRCRPFVYTMDRATYDLMLLDLAIEKGAAAAQEARITEVTKSEAGRVNGVRFQWRGEEHQVQCRMVLDASGRVNFLGRALGLRMDHEELKSFSVFGHFTDTNRASGDAEGDIRIVFYKDMWFWWAPLKAPKTSVGVVSNRDVYWKEYCEDPEAFFEKYLKTCDYIQARIGDGKRITQIKPVPGAHANAEFANYHFYCSRLTGDGWAIVGDAAGFIDPIFSAGLFVSQCAGMWLADQLLAVPAGQDPTAEEIAPYEARYNSEFGANLDNIRWFATFYFDPKFVDFFLTYGNRSEENRKLYIDTFIAYDPAAIEEFGKLVERFRRIGSKMGGNKESTASAAPAT